MSTRGAIARMTGTFPPQWAGRYHHGDSYPSGLGRTLWQLFHEQFMGDLDAMLRVLLDEHPAGWSSLHGANFSHSPGFCEFGHTKTADLEDDRPQCYCHGDRAEEGWLVTERNAAGSGCEWAYVFTSALPHAESKRPQHTMMVFASFHPGGQKMIGFFGVGDPDSTWQPVARVDLHGPEPDWEVMERR